MTYFNFTENVLDQFVEFRAYLLNEYNVNEIDLLPYNLGSLLISYYDSVVQGGQIHNIMRLKSFLTEMSVSTDKELIMLYNDIIGSIQESENLLNTLGDLSQKNPYDLHTDSKEIKQDISVKKMFLEDQSNQYEESNKQLLAKYKDVDVD